MNEETQARRALCEALTRLGRWVDTDIKWIRSPTVADLTPDAAAYLVARALDPEHHHLLKVPYLDWQIADAIYGCITISLDAWVADENADEAIRELLEQNRRLLDEPVEGSASD